jgi:hypothetical protein
MNRLLQYLGVSGEKSPAGLPSPRETTRQPSLLERYDGAALGVECAWPMPAEREVQSPTP